LLQAKRRLRGDQGCRTRRRPPGFPPAAPPKKKPPKTAKCKKFFSSQKWRINRSFVLFLLLTYEKKVRMSEKFKKSDFVREHATFSSETDANKNEVNMKWTCKKCDTVFNVTDKSYTTSVVRHIEGDECYKVKFDAWKAKKLQDDNPHGLLGVKVVVPKRPDTTFFLAEEANLVTPRWRLS
jgi:hypothetical protein